jgi:hypothetical protein
MGIKRGYVGFWNCPMEFAGTLSPSAIPNLALKLPISPHVRKRMREQLELDASLL